MAASKTRRTYAKSNSSTYVPVAGTGRMGCRASCIFSVFVAGVQLRVTHCARLLASFASPRRRYETERTKIGGGCIFVGKPCATGEEGASRLGLPATCVPALHLAHLSPDLTPNVGTGMHDKSVLDAYFRERLPVRPGMPGGDVTLQ